MRTCARLLFFVGFLCLAIATWSLFAEASLIIPSHVDVGEIMADQEATRQIEVRNLTPWPVRILGGQFG
jgi:hypothetical protein